jgi:hypothetical protein
MLLVGNDFPRGVALAAYEHQVCAAASAWVVIATGKDDGETRISGAGDTK